MNRRLIWNITFISIILAGCIIPSRVFAVDLSTTQTVINIGSIQIVADFKSYKDCLVGIKYYTGSTLEFITDQPSEISGFFSNGTHFACVEKATDRKSIFIHGLITVK
jgi:hypothetical protein